MDQFLKKFKKVITFKTDNEIRTGLLKYSKIPDDYAFLFDFDDCQRRGFHTVGMKFNINLRFYNKDKKLVKEFYNLAPGIKRIDSEFPAMYAIEYSPDFKKGD